MTQTYKKKLKLFNKSEIARELKVSPQYISMILSGKRKAPAVRKRISNMLKGYLKAS